MIVNSPLYECIMPGVYGLKIQAVTSVLDEGALSLTTLISFTSGANVPDSSDKAGRNVVLQQRNKSRLQPESGQHISEIQAYPIQSISVWACPNV